MTQPFSVQVVTAPGHTQVSVRGEIDVLTAPKLRAAVDAALHHQPGRIIVDLTDASFIDSSGLNVLVVARNRLGPCDLGVVTARDNILRVFSISGIDRIMPVFATMDQAVAGLNAEPSSAE